jgi:hypothetical protein
MNGWIKLHRKILQNEIFRQDRTAWHIFEVLLIICDKEKGLWSGGRFVLADLCKEKPSTMYKAIKRLEKAKMVTLSSNNRFTTIHICKWKEYQGNGNTSGNNQVTTKEQPSNTITRIENKELRNNYKRGFEEFFVDELKNELQDFVDHRKAIKKPMTAKAVKLLILKLEKMYPKNFEKQKECLNQSIQNGWTGVYELSNTTDIKEF